MLYIYLYAAIAGERKEMHTETETELKPSPLFSHSRIDRGVNQTPGEFGERVTGRSYGVKKQKQ